MVHRPALPFIAAAFSLAILVGLLTAGPAAAQPGPGPGDRGAADPVDDAGDLPVAYRAPVEGPVIDGFRPPARPWLPGNRGYEYATSPGQVVVAAADGKVLFAGTVARTRHVTLLHADGLRTSYSYLASIEVSRGQQVLAGTTLGRAAYTFHFGVRDSEGTYLDPGHLIGSDEVLRARLADPALFGRDRDGFETAAGRLEQAEVELAASEDEWLALELKREAIEGA